MRLIDSDLLKITSVGICDANGNNYGCADVVLAEDLEKAPTIDAEQVRHGKWFGTVCSACGESVSFNFDCDYCPKCGAKMDLSD